MISNQTAAQAVAALLARAHTVASAESLTGGQMADAFVTMPGTSAVYRGGVVAYATELKHVLLGVDAELLDARGAVDPDVAAQMATGARERMSATWGVATTGVAGPEPQDGAPVGRVYVAVDGPGGRRVRELDLPGEREEIRRRATDAALGLLLEAVRECVVPMPPAADGQHPPEQLTSADR